jgi:hypothetical protein
MYSLQNGSTYGILAPLIEKTVLLFLMPFFPDKTYLRQKKSQNIGFFTWNGGVCLEMNTKLSGETIIFCMMIEGLPVSCPVVSISYYFVVYLTFIYFGTGKLNSTTNTTTKSVAYIKRVKVQIMQKWQNIDNCRSWLIYMSVKF